MSKRLDEVLPHEIVPDNEKLPDGTTMGDLRRRLERQFSHVSQQGNIRAGQSASTHFPKSKPVRNAYSREAHEHWEFIRGFAPLVHSALNDPNSQLTDEQRREIFDDFFAATAGHKVVAADKLSRILTILSEDQRIAMQDLIQWRNEISIFKYSRLSVSQTGTTPEKNDRDIFNSINISVRLHNDGSCMVVITALRRAFQVLNLKGSSEVASNLGVILRALEGLTADEIDINKIKSILPDAIQIESNLHAGDVTQVPSEFAEHSQPLVTKLEVEYPALQTHEDNFIVKQPEDMLIREGMNNVNNAKIEKIAALKSQFNAKADLLTEEGWQAALDAIEHHVMLAELRSHPNRPGLYNDRPLIDGRRMHLTEHLRAEWMAKGFTPADYTRLQIKEYDADLMSAIETYETKRASLPSELSFRKVRNRKTARESATLKAS